MGVTSELEMLRIALFMVLCAAITLVDRSQWLHIQQKIREGPAIQVGPWGTRRLRKIGIVQNG